MEYAVSYLIGNETEGFIPKWGVVQVTQNIPVYPTNPGEESVAGHLIPKERTTEMNIIILDIRPNIVQSFGRYAIPNELLEKAKAFDALQESDYTEPEEPVEKKNPLGGKKK